MTENILEYLNDKYLVYTKLQNLDFLNRWGFLFCSSIVALSNLTEEEICTTSTNHCFQRVILNS